MNFRCARQIACWVMSFGILVIATVAQVGIGEKVAVTHDDSYFDACDRMVKMDYGSIVAPEGERMSACTRQISR